MSPRTFPINEYKTIVPLLALLKESWLLCAGVFNTNSHMYLAPRMVFEVYLADGGFIDIVAEIEHLSQLLIEFVRHITNVGFLIVERHSVWVVGVVLLEIEIQDIASLKLVNQGYSVVELEASDVEIHDK